MFVLLPHRGVGWFYRAFRVFVQDTDLVPSDIAAGLILLHQEQDKMENCPKEPEEVLCHSPSSLMVRKG